MKISAPNWRKSFNREIIFRELNKIRTQQSGKVTYDGFRFDPLFEVLFTNVVDSFPFSDKHIKRLISKAMFTPTNNGKINPLQFIKILYKLATEYSKGDPQKFFLVSTIGYKGDFPHKNIRMDGAHIDFHPPNAQNYVTQQTEELKFQLRNASQSIIQQTVSYPYCVTRVTEHNAEEAALWAIKKANKYRDLLNYYINVGNKFRISIGSTRKPVNLVRWGPFHTIYRSDGVCDDSIYLVEPDFYPTQFLPDLKIYRDDFRSFYNSAIAASRHNPLGEIAWNALLRYNDALDRSDWLFAFRELWSVFEFLTKTEKGICSPPSFWGLRISAVR